MDGRPTRVSARLAVCVSTVLTSACVSVADGPSPTDPHATTTTRPPVTTTAVVSLEGGLTAYTECLAAAGVQIDEVEFDGLGRPRLARAMSELDLNDPAVLGALDECAGELATDTLDLAPDPEIRALVIARLEEFARCVRGRGVPAFPDPYPTFDGIGSPFPDDQIPWSDEDLAEAASECRLELIGEEEGRRSVLVGSGVRAATYG